MKKYLTTFLLALGITASAQTNIQYLTISTGTNGGDSGAVGGAKINTNFWFVQGEIVSLLASNGVVSATLMSATGTIAAIQAQIAPGGQMDFDSSNIYSDGSGDIFAKYIKASLEDSTNSTGSAGFVPIANGDGTWFWTAPLVTSDGAGGIVFLTGNSGVDSAGHYWQMDETTGGQTNYLHLNSGVATWTTSP